MNSTPALLLATDEELLVERLLARDEQALRILYDRYDAGRGRLFTWMVRVCCNQAIDALRSPRHRFHSGTRSLDVGGAQHAVAASTFNPEHIGLRELTLQLKPRQREVIDLLYFIGCTQAETAERLGIPLATVKTRARAALQTLAKMAR